MFFRKKTPKSGAARLEQEMTVIAEQAMANAAALRNQTAMSPITHAKTEKLFAETNAAGDTVFNHYHFSQDMNQLDPEAQIHLMQFFGQIIAFNEMLEHPGVERRLDWLIANAFFFERYFARADVSTALLQNRPKGETDQSLHAITTADELRIQRIHASMFEPHTFENIIPRPAIPFMIAVGKPYEEGQKFINGVYFSAHTAPAVMSWIASLQSQGSQAVRDNNPKHA